MPKVSAGRIKKWGSLVVATALLAVSGCAENDATTGSEKFQVVASTPILADLAQGVAGDRAKVSSLVPAGADPHSYEPSLRDIRQIAYADLAFTNGLMLEQNKLTRTIEANLPDGVQPLAVAEGIDQYGGELKRMVEDASLDSLWLGLRVEGGEPGESTSFSARRMTGPGQSAAFITGTFGSVEVVANSLARGAHREQDGERMVSTGDLGSVELPAQAHTHLSWAFGEAGNYEISLGVQSESGIEVPATTVHFAVGEQAQELAVSLGKNTRVLDAGHADITANLDQKTLSIRTDSGEQVEYLDPAHTVIEVPSRTLQEVPAGSHFRFLEGENEEVYLLAQAVLGKHVHGDIDPHFWHSVPNVKAAVQLMRDSLKAADPAGAADYDRNTRQLLGDLDTLDADLRATYGSLSKSAQNLMTTHDGYRYLAETYGLKVAGFVTAVEGAEPSPQQRSRLRRTVEDLQVPALYLDRGVLQRASVLREVAEDTGTRVCELYSDTLDARAPHYSDMMRHNAQTIEDCSEGS